MAASLPCLSPRWVTLSEPSHKTSAYPTPRSFHTCTSFSESTNTVLILFGGVTGDSEHAEYLNDIWVKTADEETWRNDVVVFSGSSNVPARRCRHTAVALKQGLFVFGGANGSLGYGSVVDASVFKLERVISKADKGHQKFRWIRLLTMGDEPCARFGHCAEALNETCFIVFGGRTVRDGSELNDFFTFDSIRNVWSRIQMHGLLKPPPGCDYFLCRFQAPGEEDGGASSQTPSLLLIGARPGEDQDEFVGHHPMENIVAFVLSNRNLKKQWSCVPLRFLGLRGNATRQASSRTFRQKLCLVDASVLEDVHQESDTGWSANGSNGGGDRVTNHHRSSVVFFPGDRWFPTFFRFANHMYLTGGVSKKSGERPSLQFIWRFPLDSVALTSTFYLAAWECIRLVNTNVLNSRVGWSFVEVPARVIVAKSRPEDDPISSIAEETALESSKMEESRILTEQSQEHSYFPDLEEVSDQIQLSSSSSSLLLFVFGGTDVKNSYLDDTQGGDGDDENTRESEISREFDRDESSFDHAKPANTLRAFVDSPLVLDFYPSHIGRVFSKVDLLPFTEEHQGNQETVSKTRVTFATPSIAVRFIRGVPYVQQLPQVQAAASRAPNVANSLNSFKVFESNVIWAVAWDLSLFMFYPSSTTKMGVADSVFSPVKMKTMNGLWSRIAKPLVPPSPSTGTQFEFIGSELSVLWPDANREGFAVERFCPNQFYLKNRTFVDFERAFEGDVLVLMGGMRRSAAKDLNKAAKLLGVVLEEGATPVHGTDSTKSASEKMFDHSAKGNKATAGEEDQYLNDVWIGYSTFSSRRNYFSPPSVSLCSWKKLWPPSEVSGTVAEDSLFEGRARHSLTALPTLGMLVVFGGMNGQRLPVSASLVLVDFTVRSREFSNASLSVPATSGRGPCPRFNHAAAATPDDEAPRLVICGGKSFSPSPAFLQDVFVWEVCTGAWTEVCTDFPVQSLGWLHYHEGEFFFFGEHSGDEDDEQNSSVMKFSLS